jgi:hypothetical protein
MNVIDQEELDELLKKAPRLYNTNEPVRGYIEPPLNFTNLILKELTIKGRNLNAAIFENCIIEDCDFTRASCHGANFKNSKIAGTTFTRTDLSDADFTNAEIIKCTILDSWVHTANFTNTTIEGVDFRSSDLRNSDFTEAEIRVCDFNYCDLEHTKLDVKHMEAVIGNGREIKTIQTELAHVIVYTNKRMAIGSKQGSLKTWWDITDEQLKHIYREPFLEFWKKWKPILKSIGVFDETIKELEKNTPAYTGAGQSVLKKKQRKVII